MVTHCASTMLLTAHLIGVISLTIGLTASGLLCLAVVADYWLYTSELLPIDQPIPMPKNESAIKAFPINMHSGLWRACIYMDDLPDGEEMPASCFTIGYSQVWDRVEGGDTTNSIIRGIRKSTPLLVIGLLILVLAVAFSTLGNAKSNAKTLIGAILYIFSALSLGLGMIFYISAVNDEVSRLKEPKKGDPPIFVYDYGWAVHCSGTAFVLSMIVSVTNISLYLSRFPKLEDMVQIIPGLEKKTGLNVYSVGEDEEDKEEKNEKPNSTYNRGQPTLIM